MKLWDNPLPWILLAVSLAVDLGIGFVLAPLRRGFDHLRQPLVSLAAEKSPARPWYVVWLGLFGAALCLEAANLLTTFLDVAAGWSATLTVSLAAYAVCSCLMPAFTRADGEKSFRANRPKNVTFYRTSVFFGQTMLLAAVFALGMLLLLAGLVFPGIAAMVSFAAMIALYVCVLLSGKPKYAGTRLDRLGLWLRLYVAAAYLPFATLALWLLLV